MKQKNRYVNVVNVVNVSNPYYVLIKKCKIIVKTVTTFTTVTYFFGVLNAK